MMLRSWYGNATFMTMRGWDSADQRNQFGRMSMTTCAVDTRLPLDLLRDPVALNRVLLASQMSLNTPGSWAHLCVTTRPTLPAPIIKTLLIVLPNNLKMEPKLNGTCLSRNSIQTALNCGSNRCKNPVSSNSKQYA